MQREDVFNLAKLAQIAISVDEADYFANSISKIVDLVDKLNSIDTSKISPLIHTCANQTALREDKVTETNQIIALEANAPQTAAGLFLVPQVIDHNE